MPVKKAATPLKVKNDSKAGKRTPAKRPIDKDDQTSTPKRRRCLFANPSNEPERYEDPSKIGSLAGLFLNREKIRLPGKTHIINLVDHRMQIHDPLCTPVFPAKVPLDTIVNDFLIFKKFIRANKKATQIQIVQHAWGISEMVRMFNENIRSHILTSPEFKEFDKKRAKKGCPSQTYGVIHLMRLISKLHEIYIPLSIYEDIKEEMPEFMKFIDENYKKYWNREAEYPSTDKHSFEAKTGIRWLE
ncbi:hypothetical protein L5515_016920 [Caenorhabditis briggsae]|uniref:MRG domain-containing protein n=1 Tax=Caenorhabditis briggsae TaxID=6238 RepID=A0AAE9F7A1_CAEBR|nr:hypothetical protein L5515_016920 [Caenorhabditis briggsae]